MIEPPAAAGSAWGVPVWTRPTPIAWITVPAIQIQTWASAVQSITPTLPAVNVPFAEKLPKPQDLVANAYDFAEQLLASQRKFAEDVLSATAPLTAGKDETPAKKNGSAAK